MKKNSGFTLVELMVVIAIVAILMAISLPRMVSWRDEQQLNLAARQIQSTLQNLRIRAIKENSMTWFWFDDATHYETVVLNRTPTQWGGVNFIWNEWNNGNPFSLPPGIQGNFNIWGVTFNSRGMVMGNANGVITLTNKQGHSRQITLMMTGVSRIS
jgi:prepilin-type N-terminal cleavage/methylation domain-containing protein